MAAPSPGPPSSWTPQQDKVFEQALALYDDASASRWENVAAMVPGKDAAQVRKHYELLVEDVNCIEAGRIALPRYNSNSFREGYGDPSGMGGDLFIVKKSAGLYPAQVPSVGKGSAKAADQERKKGIPWTEEEHKLFLLGLEKFGKGDWRSISRNFVVSRTPTQVASHAQKYFIRLNSINKDKRRSSIHDITSIGNGQSSSSPPPPSSSASSSMVPPPPTSHSRPPLYIPASLDQPISSPLPSPIAPPILLPSPLPHLARPTLPPSPRPTHISYSLPQTAMHQ